MQLTSREKDKLNKAILSYLIKSFFEETANTFMHEASISEDTSFSDILEKKWSSVVRLQQKNMQLTSELNSLKEEMSMYGPGLKLADSNSKRLEGVPRIPAKFELKGHREVISCVIFHPVYSILASSSEDASIRLWDYETGEEEKVLRGHTGAVNALAFEPRTGLVLASCSSDMTLKVWSLESYDCTRTLTGHDHNVSFVEFVPNGDFLLSCSRDASIKMWEVASGFCIRTFVGHDSWVKHLATNESGSLMASGSKDQTVRIWNVENSSAVEILSGHSNVVECVSFAFGSGNEILIHSKESEEEKTGNKTREFVASGGRDKTIRVWDSLNGTCVYLLRGHDNWVRKVVFEPFGKYLYSCSDDKSIRLWDLETGACSKKILDAHTHFIISLAVNPRFPMLATGSVDKSIKIWECR